ATNDPVTATGVANCAGAASYDTATQPGGMTASISAKNLTISGAVANDRIYNGTASATVDFSGATLNGKVSGDAVSIDSSGYSASFANKNVGTSKPVTVTGVAPSGGDSGNYTISQPSGLTATINKRNVTASVSATAKTSDGTDAGTITGCSLEAQAANHGVVSPDAVNCAGSNGHFGTATAGANKTVTGDVALTGADKDNYQLTSGTAATTATINKRNVTASDRNANKLNDSNDPTTNTGCCL